MASIHLYHFSLLKSSVKRIKLLGFYMYLPITMFQFTDENEGALTVRLIWAVPHAKVKALGAAGWQEFTQRPYLWLHKEILIDGVCVPDLACQGTFMSVLDVDHTDVESELTGAPQPALQKVVHALSFDKNSDSLVDEKSCQLQALQLCSCKANNIVNGVPVVTY